MYLLPGLKRLCGKTLAQTLCQDNVVYMWKTAKLFQLSRLEDQCVEYMAKIIYQVSATGDRSWGLANPQLRCMRSSTQTLVHVRWWCIHARRSRLSQLVEQPDLAEVIKEDADSVEGREATDSVPLVDEIRFHITSNVQTYSEIEEANQKLEALEELLSSINICCWGACRVFKGESCIGGSRY